MDVERKLEDTRIIIWVLLLAPILIIGIPIIAMLAIYLAPVALLVGVIVCIAKYKHKIPVYKEGRIGSIKMPKVVQKMNVAFNKILITTLVLIGLGVMLITCPIIYTVLFVVMVLIICEAGKQK